MYESNNAITRPSYEGSAPMVQIGNGNGGILDGLPPEVAREVTQVLAQFQMAMYRPRNIPQVFKKLDDMCSRVGLASAAMYSYPRGNTAVTGPSIRLAEALAKAYTNIKSGTEEVSVTATETKMRAYCLDLETNMLEEKIFTVKHIRDTKAGSKKLTDQRDIYELAANNGARRLRSCILSIIPSDIVDYAIEKCQETLRSKVEITAETIEKMIVAFAKFHVNRDMLEARINTVLENMGPARYIDLQNIYVSLRDGVGKVDDFFDIQLSDAGKAARKAAEEAQASASNATPKKVKIEKPEPTPAPKKEEPQPEPDPAPAEETGGPESFKDDGLGDSNDYDPSTGEVYDEDETKSFDEIWN